MPHSSRAARAALAALLLAAAVPWASAQAPAPEAERPAAEARPADAAVTVALDPTRRRGPAPFFERHLPDALRDIGPRGLLWWQWLALPSLFVVAIVVGSFLGWATRRVLGHLASRTQTRWDDVLLDRVAAPLTALWAVAVVTTLQPWLDLPPNVASVLHHLLRAATYFVVFWGGLRSVNVAFAMAAEASWTRANASLAGFLPVARKFAKVVLLAIGLVAVMNELGFQVASLLAGLGIGGIALALAAQKTVENVFGSISIGVDQPFRVGDFVKVEDFTGTVETIGMRSTRFRTLDRTLVTIPNGKLADTRTETFAVRDRLRLFANLGLVYSTTPAQLRQVLAELEALLRAHPKIWPDAVTVRFTAFAESALNVEIMAWFQTADWGEFTLIRQELFIAFMEVVERAGSSFAFPTRTVHVVGEGATGRGGAGKAEGPALPPGPRIGGAERDRTDDL